MFSDLPISPQEVFDGKDYIFDAPGAKEIPDGAEVLVVHAEESKALYIDGEQVYNYDDLPTSRIMAFINDHTDGNLAAFGTQEAVYDKRTGESLYNKDLPEDPSDIVFGHQISTIRIRTADDLQKLDSDTARNAEYLQVRVTGDGISEDLIRNFVGEDVDIFKLIT